eukprot:gene44973-55977_t
MAASTVVFVGESKEWIADLVERSKTLKLNAGHEAGTDVGPVISCAAVERISSLIERGIAEGAKLELDGRKPLVPGYEQGNFVGPTIFSGVKPGMAIDDDPLIAMTRDALGRTLSERLGTGLERRFAYDERDLLTAQRLLEDAGPVFETRYDYDGA